MIQIQHSDLEKIENDYTTGVVKTILERQENLKDVIVLLKNGNVTHSDIKNKFNPYRSALKAILNKDDLHSKNIAELIINIQKYSSISNQRIDFTNSCISIFSEVKLMELIGSKPFLLKGLQEKLLNSLNYIVKKDLLFEYIFDYYYYYEQHISPIGNRLNLTVCPYCNRNFITNVLKGNKRIIGPTFDHFFHQAENPLLTLSFYNLIPSCSICNSNLKNQKKFNIDTHLHPYLHKMGDDAKFNFKLSTIKNGEKIKKIFLPTLEVLIQKESANYYRLETSSIKNAEDSTGSINVFKLREVYATHSDIVEEIHSKFDKNSPFYVLSIAKKLKALGVKEEEFYRFHFGNYFNPDDFNKRPLAKFTKDIYESFVRIEPLFE